MNAGVRPWVAVAVSCALAFGCNESAARSPASAEPTRPEAPLLLKVALLQPGGEPRAQRRYLLLPRQVVNFTAVPHSERVVNGQRTVEPPATVSITYAITRAGRDDVHEMQIINYDFVMPDLGPHDEEPFRRMRAAMKGLSASVAITPRGISGLPHLAAEYAGPGEFADTVAPHMLQALAHVAPPLPEEPIGVGARWKTVEESEQDGTVLTITTVFTLTSWSGSTGVIDAAVTRSAPPRALTASDIASGTMELGGSATYHFELARNGLAARGTSDETLTLHASATGTDGTHTDARTAVHLERTAMVVRE